MLNNGYNVIKVITTLHSSLTEGMVHRVAIAQNIEAQCTTNFEEMYSEVKKSNPDLQIVISFKKLPENIWSFPKYGTVNLHFSLLPQYRGAAPINWVIMNGEKVTGVTTFFVNDKLDCGDIILQKEVALQEGESYHSLGAKLCHVGTFLIYDTIDEIIKHGKNVKTYHNAEYLPICKKAPKITKEICTIDFSKSSTELMNWYTGLSNYNRYWEVVYKNGKKQLLIIKSANFVPQPRGLKPGELLSDGKSFLHIGCKDGEVVIYEIQVPGKRDKITISEFLNGYKSRLNYTQYSG